MNGNFQLKEKAEPYTGFRPARGEVFGLFLFVIVVVTFVKFLF